VNGVVSWTPDLFNIHRRCVDGTCNKSYDTRGMQECSWLRHYATSWKVVGSIPDVLFN
jgi:hypothetical protein